MVGAVLADDLMRISEDKICGETVQIIKIKIVGGVTRSPTWIWSLILPINPSQLLFIAEVENF